MAFITKAYESGEMHTKSSTFTSLLGEADCRLPTLLSRERGRGGSRDQAFGNSRTKSRLRRPSSAMRNGLMVRVRALNDVPADVAEKVIRLIEEWEKTTSIDPASP